MNSANARGYVLLEVLVALLIFSLGLLGMIGFQGAAMKIGTDSRFRTEAAMLADELIGQMTLDPIGSVQSDFGPGGNKLTSWVNTRVVGQAKLPNVQVVPSFSAGNTAASLLVTVTITWTMPDAGSATGTDVQSLSRNAKYVTNALLF